MTDDKSKLLRSLTIDRSASKAERSKSRWLPVSAAIVACVVAFAAFGAYEFRRQDPPKETAPQIAQQSAAQPQTAQQPQQAAPNNKAAGNLAASGYVVARRKATVAAEITGKVVEVFIDEGMVVTEGQVVARLDSMLAETDLTWPTRASRRPKPPSPRSPPIWTTRPDPGARTDPVAEEFRQRGRPDQGGGPGRRAARPIAPGAGAIRDRPARRQAQRHGARQASDPRAVRAASSSSAAPSPAR